MTDQESIESPETESRRNLFTPLFVAIALVLLTLVGYGLLSSGGSGRPKRGEPVPDFALTLLDGSELTLDDLRGKVVVLNFWASWCAPCRREASALQRVWEATQDQGVVFVGVAYRDARAASIAFLEEYGITYPNGVDLGGRISDAYGVTAVPETYLIDREGRLAWSQIGEVQAVADQKLQRLGIRTKQAVFGSAGVRDQEQNVSAALFLRHGDLDGRALKIDVNPAARLAGAGRRRRKKRELKSLGPNPALLPRVRLANDDCPAGYRSFDGDGGSACLLHPGGTPGPQVRLVQPIQDLHQVRPGSVAEGIPLQIVTHSPAKRVLTYQGL